MDFTFGIVTTGNYDSYVNQIIDSIESQNIKNYEIIIVGNSLVSRNKTKIINFDESVKPNWITKKKNIITDESKYENIVYLHDYLQFEDGWYDGHLKSGNKFKVRMDKIITLEGQRFRDWCLWVQNHNHMDSLIRHDEALIPYDLTHLSKYMYISGAYWVAKKEIMKEFPLNESISWMEGEDVEWSLRVRNKYDFNMNINSTVKIVKPNKGRVYGETSPEKIEILKQIK